ncbi:hypothetical protein SAMN05216565_11249 [Litchfieldia salsa]|uniref:Uncharacterized protein n=1 Tax=Litchfieldia salsa TaxID=930152 RepID=A0A1H0WLP7_9BACI|nr:hypothetical protein SAMN05216565_11249 [Litchfieldia salsa]
MNFFICVPKRSCLVYETFHSLIRNIGIILASA